MLSPAVLSRWTAVPSPVIIPAVLTVDTLLIVWNLTLTVVRVWTEAEAIVGGNTFSLLLAVFGGGLIYLTSLFLIAHVLVLSGSGFLPRRMHNWSLSKAQLVLRGLPVRVYEVYPLVIIMHRHLSFFITLKLILLVALLSVAVFRLLLMLTSATSGCHAYWLLFLGGRIAIVDAAVVLSAVILSLMTA